MAKKNDINNFADFFRNETAESLKRPSTVTGELEVPTKEEIKAEVKVEEVTKEDKVMVKRKKKPKKRYKDYALRLTMDNFDKLQNFLDESEEYESLNGLINRIISEWFSK